ncbi:hypothetical protein FACS18949_05640 [Clostridia bacterium]|nr:hypothetical protein FACS18949_05640 [Clostridia bacterium]
MTDRKGSALAVVLVFMMIAVTMGTAILFAANHQSKVSASVAAYEQDYYIAESAVRLAAIFGARAEVEAEALFPGADVKLWFVPLDDGEVEIHASVGNREAYSGQHGILRK